MSARRRTSSVPASDSLGSMKPSSFANQRTWTKRDSIRRKEMSRTGSDLTSGSVAMTREGSSLVNGSAYIARSDTRNHKKGDDSANNIFIFGSPVVDSENQIGQLEEMGYHGSDTSKSRHSSYSSALIDFSFTKNIQPVIINISSAENNITTPLPEEVADTRNLPMPTIGQYEYSLRNHVRIHMAIQYAYFTIFLAVSTSVLSLPFQWYQIILFAVLSGFISDFTRWLDFRTPNNCFWWCLSLLPYFHLQMIVPSSIKGPIAILWLISTNLVFLQSAQSNVARDMIIHFVLIISLNCLAELTITFINSTCVSFNTCLSSLSSIFYFKILVVLCGIWVQWTFLCLEKLIQLNNLALLERENYMQQLFLTNIDLKRKVRKFNKEIKSHLESPLETAIYILKTLIEDVDDDGLAEEIICAIELLSKNELMRPELGIEIEDPQVHDWLKDLLLTDVQSFNNSSLHPDNELTVISEVDMNLKTVDVHIFEYLQASTHVDFDVLHLEVLTNGHALYYLGMHLFHRFHIAARLNIKVDVLARWLTKVESEYRHTNPYHNSTHAADVLHTFTYFFSRPNIKPYLNNEDIFACLVASIVHDYMHPVATADPLAIRYNDLSVLEYFHTASLFEMMQDPELNILANFPTDQKKNIRDMIIGMILATDMSSHFDWIGKFKSKMASAGINWEHKVDKKLCLNITIKCADVNNSCKILPLSRKWTQLIMDEFFLQGEEEKRRGVPVSAFMNRETTDIPKCQIGFIEFIVQPLYETYALFLQEDLDHQLRNILINKAFWKKCTETPNYFEGVELEQFIRSSHPSMIAQKSTTSLTGYSPNRRSSDISPGRISFSRPLQPESQPHIYSIGSSMTPGREYTNGSIAISQYENSLLIKTKAIQDSQFSMLRTPPATESTHNTFKLAPTDDSSVSRRTSYNSGMKELPIQRGNMHSNGMQSFYLPLKLKQLKEDDGSFVNLLDRRKKDLSPIREKGSASNLRSDLLKRREIAKNSSISSLKASSDHLKIRKKTDESR